MDRTERVAAFVVTYRRPALLGATLSGILSQSRPLDAVIVINNDPTDGLREILWDEFPGVEVVDLAENVGSAGGFARALYIADRCAFTWAWLLDDDSIPEPAALERMLDARNALRQGGRRVALLAPMQVSSNGPYGGALWRDRIVAIPPSRRSGDEPFDIDLAYWAGLLVHRDVVACVGFPRTDFFRCYADYEFCLRARRAGLQIVAVPGSRVRHHEGEYRTVVRWGRRSVRRSAQPVRFYYDARNAAYVAWHTLRRPRAALFHILRQVKLAVGDLLYEDRKLYRARLRLWGTLDGLRGRLGRREDLE